MMWWANNFCYSLGPRYLGICHKRTCIRNLDLRVSIVLKASKSEGAKNLWVDAPAAPVLTHSLVIIIHYHEYFGKLSNAKQTIA